MLLIWPINYTGLSSGRGWISATLMTITGGGMCAICVMAAWFRRRRLGTPCSRSLWWLIEKLGRRSRGGVGVGEESGIQRTNSRGLAVDRDCRSDFGTVYNNSGGLRVVSCEVWWTWVEFREGSMSCVCFRVFDKIWLVNRRFTAEVTSWCEIGALEGAALYGQVMKSTLFACR